MSSDSFNANETCFSFNWPSTLSGIERVALSAKGDLQRTLSAYFSHPISVARGYTSPDPSAPISSASHATPLEQIRSVDLICRGRIVCMCTSTVTMTSPAAAQLVLVDKYPIGQVFRALGTGPAFQLLDVGLTEGGKGLWRVYTLKTDEFQCRIREEFPDRAMFHCDNWLDLPAQSVANRLPAVVDSGKSVVAH
ncbi:hypothetical protein AG1IA_01836 [Rhizoctonia solani AG-1 IA]|uniref:Uncharacterized protein n=2 Tax=Rhizoctonia solani TaxID=456999 RepID=A0A8H7H0I9_9AGAM